MATGKGEAVLTARTIDIETTAIDPKTQKIQGKSDDVLGMIAQLSSKVSADMNLAPKPGRRADAGDAGAKSTGATQSGTPATKTAPGVDPYFHAISPDVVKKTMSTKLDVATMKTYSKALDEMDKKNKASAITLLKEVAAKYPEFEPAQRNLKNLGA